jgi:hypothetical protein
MADALLPFLLTSAAVSATPFSLMSAQTTLAPSRAQISAVARPMPLAAPVTMMVFPAKVGCLWHRLHCLDGDCAFDD